MRALRTTLRYYRANAQCAYAPPDDEILGNWRIFLYHRTPTAKAATPELYRSLLIRKFDMQAILDYLKNSGERLDTEIATATGLSLANVRTGVNDLKARGAIMVCRSIRYQDGKEIDGILCRISGYIPQAAPGRKPKSHAAPKSESHHD